MKSSSNTKRKDNENINIANDSDTDTKKQKTKDKLAVKVKKTVEYEVEKILSQAVRNGKQMFLVKWLNWAEEHNTWEPVAHLQNCPKLLADFIQKEYDRNSGELGALRAQLAPPETRTKIALEQLMKEPGTLAPPDESRLQQRLLALLQIPKHKQDATQVALAAREIRIIALHNARSQQLAALKEWEIEMNYSAAENTPIRVENNVDLEGPPKQFHYINSYIPGEGVVIPDDPPIGCECVLCTPRQTNCCFHQGGGNCYVQGRIRVTQGSPVYECNSRCKCDIKCPNRVVERGRTYPLCIFRTDNGRGWGVKAMKFIPYGRFVCEYVGEVITHDEAEKRGRIYDAQGRTYLFDLDFNSADFLYTVDAARYGNLSHFINHSCKPNLGVWSVWGNCLDPNIPKLALFALDDIDKGEEITFDYMSQPNEQADSSTSLRSRLDLPKNTRDSLAPRSKCKCGTPECRQYLF